MSAAGTPRTLGGLALLLWLGLGLPPLRHALESSMSAHMLIQMPLLAAAGFAAARALRAGVRARLLRWTGIAMVLLGTIGIALGGHGDWFVPPSWISFGLGWVLVLCGVVRRERTTPVGGGK